MWGAEWPQKKNIKYDFNILKTEAAQTIFLTAQTSTNGAQTIETVFREFGACGGLSDVFAYISMSNMLKTEAAQTNFLPAQTSTNEAQMIETVLATFCVGWGPTSMTSCFKHLWYCKAFIIAQLFSCAEKFSWKIHFSIMKKCAKKCVSWKIKTFKMKITWN